MGYSPDKFKFIFLGCFAFHDIDCPDFPGVKKFWEEIKSEKFYDTKEFVYMGHFIQYGIGMVSIK